MILRYVVVAVIFSTFSVVVFVIVVVVVVSAKGFVCKVRRRRNVHKTSSMLRNQLSPSLPKIPELSTHTHSSSSSIFYLMSAHSVVILDRS